MVTKINPEQIKPGSASEILSTDGNSVSWAQKDASDFEGAAGSQGQVLTTDGTNASWEDAPEGIPLGTNTGQYWSESVAQTIAGHAEEVVNTVDAVYQHGGASIVEIGPRSEAIGSGGGDRGFGDGGDDSGIVPVTFEFDGSGNINGIELTTQNTSSDHFVIIRFWGVVG